MNKTNIFSIIVAVVITGGLFTIALNSNQETSTDQSATVFLAQNYPNTSPTPTSSPTPTPSPSTNNCPSIQDLYNQSQKIKDLVADNIRYRDSEMKNWKIYDSLPHNSSNEHDWKYPENEALR
jgi:hypothetical protein